MEEKLLVALQDYIRENRKAVYSKYKITIDGKPYFFVMDDYDDDFLDLGEFINEHNKSHPDEKIGENEKIEGLYYVLVHNLSIRILHVILVLKTGFSDAFFAREFVSNKRTKEVRFKE